jgi:uncharacterized alkaline shock family protein YloU
MTQTAVTSDDKAAPGATRSVESMPARQNRLNTEEGRISVAEGVVQKIAGVACREVSGVHAMGTGGSRAFNALRERIPGSTGSNVAQGVGVEVGESEAAVDLQIVVEYGVSIADVGRAVQRNIRRSIEQMTGLSVVEVNVSVDDVHLPDSDEDQSESRVS